MEHKRMEVLAPAGGSEQLLAAVRCGADAVYLGAKGFNARRNAENFDEGTLPETVAFCHARGVRVHVTLNTLVTDAEMDALDEEIRAIARSGADAVIVQDLAVAARVREICPQLQLHASTQMALHNAQGVLQAEALGFSRVVLARELSIAEIRRIREKTSIELETFVHGALCMSVSGACALSSMLGGRSGNRGLCAQPCRLDFRAGERGYALSLKDLCAFEHLQALADAGVCSLKIEGRMKRAEYVAAAVTACRQALAGEAYSLETLRAAFSRGGFTDGYLTGKRTLAMFGVRSQEDVAATRKASAALAPLYRRERQSVPVDLALTIRQDGASLSATDGQARAEASCGAPQAAAVAATDEARARASLAKMGGTPFFLRDFSFDSDGEWVLPSAALNALRRDALAALLAQRETPRPHAVHPAPRQALPPFACAQPPAIRLRFAHAAQLRDDAFALAERILLPLAEIDEALLARHGRQIIAELPALIFPQDEEKTQARLRALAGAGLEAALCENLGSLRMVRRLGLRAHGGAGLNLLNSFALAQAQALGLCDATVSFELSMAAIGALRGTLPRGLIAYGRLPLMRMRCCPLQTQGGCGACPGGGELTDRKGVRFPVRCDARRYSTLHNSVPLNLAGEQTAGVSFITLYFTVESARECQRISRSFLAGERDDAPRTRGLYYRTLL